MKRKLFTAIAVILLAAGLAMLIVPRISNRVGDQIAHTTVEDFKALKSKSTYDEPTEKKESSEESTQRENPKAESLRVLQVEEKGLNPESRNSSDNVPKIDFDRLFSDSIAYNENLKKHQHELLVSEQSYLKPSLDLSSYGITSGVYGYISAPSIGLELPIYLGGNDDNMALGAAHMTCTSLPVGGNSTNCVLSGHSGYIGRIFFDYIPNLSIGDEITVENYWNTLTYEYMANQLAAVLLMPDAFVEKAFDSLFGVKRIERIHSILDKMIFKKFCAMAALFGVSKSALAIRLQKKGLLGEYIFAGYESILDIFPDTAA